MKIINKILLSVFGLIVLAACDKDGDLIYMTGLKSGNLAATETNIVLSQEVDDNIVTSLAWSTSNLVVSDTTASAPNVLSVTLQVSLSEDFAIKTEITETSLSAAFTGSALNTLAKNLGATPGEATPVYFRIKQSIASNEDPVYSNIVTITVTPYQIDMSVGYILNSKSEDTGITLYSAESNGKYLGFIGATAWYNFYLKEGDKTTWGNYGEDGHVFVLSSNDSKWSCWFPGQGGCYYVDLNTISSTWSALYIPTLTLTGDLKGDMTYDRSHNKWYYNYTASKTGTITVQISGTGAQYNTITGTTDASAISTAISFAQSGENITFGTGNATNIQINVKKTGKVALVLDLSNPKSYSCTVTDAISDNTVSRQLWISGIDDGNNGGSWTFDNYLTLYDEDNLAYATVLNVNSLYGYQFYTAEEDWSSNYGTSDGTSASGTLVAAGGNIPAPTAGLYLFDASITNLTYALTAVTNVSYAGFNDDWTMVALTASSEAPTTFTGTVTISKASQSGFKIYLNNSWDYFFGGSNGSLSYKGNGITDDATLATGIYILTVDLAKQTYTLSN